VNVVVKLVVNPVADSHAWLPLRRCR
jgi:hypothetical protein